MAIAPAVLLLGFLLHPFTGVGPPDDAAIAAAAVSHPRLWGASHLIIALGSGLLALAFLAIRSHLRDVGEERSSPRALSFMVMSTV